MMWILEGLLKTAASFFDAGTIEFRFPAAWWLLIFLPVGLIWLGRALRERKKAAGVLGVRAPVFCNFLAGLGFLLTLTAFVVALAEPYAFQITKKPVWKGEVLDFVFDLSPSQRAEDISPSRLEAEKRAVLSALDTLTKEGVWRVCVGFFTVGFNRWLECTTDMDLVKDSIRDLDFSLASDPGTNLLAALPDDYEALRKETPKNPVRLTLFIITDGGKELWYDKFGNLQVSPPDWEEKKLQENIAGFIKEGVRIVPIGVGGEKPVPVYVVDYYGKRSPITTVNNEEIFTVLDEDIIKKIALWSGTPERYFILRPGADLAKWIAGNVLLTREVDYYISERKEKELWRYPLALGVITGSLALGVLGIGVRFWKKIF